MKMKLPFALLLLCAGLVPALAQDKPLTIDDIYVYGKFSTRSPRKLPWNDGGRQLSYTQRTTAEGNTLWVEHCEWSPDGSKALIFTNSKRVWRTNTKGDYWVYDSGRDTLMQVGKGLKASELMYAKLSPDGSKVGYVYENNIYVEDFKGNRLALTTDGNELIVNGISDWVYEEELDLSDCWRWSPDGRSVAYWQFDTSGTGHFSIINNLDSIYPKMATFPYPKACTLNAAAKVGAVDVPASLEWARTPASRWFDIPGDPRENYIVRMDFVPKHDSRVLIIRTDREEKVCELFYGDIHTMKFQKFFEDRDEAFIEMGRLMDPIWIEDGKSFLWRSESDGWSHLWKISADGDKRTLVSDLKGDVMGVCGADTDGGWIYYYASPENATGQYLWRSRFEGKARTERVTPVSAPAGTHQYRISPDFKTAVHTFSANNVPPVHEYVTLPAHKVTEVLEANGDAASAFREYGLHSREYFTVTIPAKGGLQMVDGEVVDAPKAMLPGTRKRSFSADSVTLDGWMIKPKDFDPLKKYPVIFYVYGEPASSTVADRWSLQNIWHCFLAQQGYIVASVDPRGTNNPKGREWRKSVYGWIGTIPPADHAEAVKALTARYPYFDASRIGIWGWSGGGSSTVHAMLKYPDIYKAGLAVAGVYSVYLYDTAYQERYMGLPQKNKVGYDSGSSIYWTTRLKGPLMLIHGTGDDNVHYQCMEQLVDALVRDGKVFDMMSYPMRTHSVSERANTTPHLYNTMLNFWKNNL